MRHFVALAVVGFTLLQMIGCASQASVNALRKRVAALEESQKARETESQQHREELENCVIVDAHDAYWDYVKLNGT